MEQSTMFVDLKDSGRLTESSEQSTTEKAF